MWIRFCLTVAPFPRSLEKTIEHNFVLLCDPPSRIHIRRKIIRCNINGALSWHTTYTYDPVGNRLTQTANGVTTNYTYNTLNRVTNALNVAGKLKVAFLTAFFSQALINWCEEQGDCDIEDLANQLEATGRDLAEEACSLSRQIAVSLGRDIMRNVTIAVGKVGDEIVYAVNSSARSDVVNRLM